mgnify:CR=1 FL=1
MEMSLEDYRAYIETLARQAREDGFDVNKRTKNERLETPLPKWVNFNEYSSSQ